MRKIPIICCLFLFTSSAIGQQFLWSTQKDTVLKYVPLESVTKEVMEFYDHYEYYYDGAGYSKDGFSKYFEKFGDDSEGWESFKKLISEIEDLTVFAFRGNLGRGSVILVMSINKNDVNFISFSNYSERDVISANSYDRNKFEKWFSSLLNLTAPTIDEPGILNPNLPSIEDIIGDIEPEFDAAGQRKFDASGDGIFGRKVIHHPYDELSKVYAKKGRIWIQTCINPMGRVTYVEIDELNTTVKDYSVLRNALEAARNYKFETDFTAPKEQCGVVRIKVDNYRGIRN